MKLIALSIISLLACTFALAQNEQSPLAEKDVAYKNWTYKNVRTGEEANLRDLTRGKKLAIVIYYAPWCPNWRHDAPALQAFYDKYKAAGLEIIGVAEYDPVDSMKANLDTLKVTFPVYYESVDRADKQKTLHYEYRSSTGDTRNWGSPWYILLDPPALEKQGDILTKHTHIINGEMIMDEGEKFIRAHLSLPAADAKATTAGKDKIDPCDIATPAAVKKP